MVDESKHPAPAPSPVQLPKAKENPDEELKKLKQQVQDDVSKIASLTAEVGGFNLDIAILTSGITEIEQIVKQYKQALDARNLAEMTGFVSRQYAMAVGGLGANLDKVKQTIGQYDADTTTLRDKINNTLLPDADEAAANYALAQEEVVAAQSKYDDAKGAVGRLSNITADLKALKQQVTAASDSGDSAAMFFLVTVMQADLQINFPDEAGLRTLLSDSLSELKESKKKLRTAQGTQQQKGRTGQSSADLTERDSGVEGRHTGGSQETKFVGTTDGDIKIAVDRSLNETTWPTTQPLPKLERLSKHCCSADASRPRPIQLVW